MPYEREITLRLINEISSGKYNAFISSLVILEINRAPDKIKTKLIDVVKSINPEELEIDDEVLYLAERYLRQGIVPQKYENDALHIAIASVNDLDVLVSWNFKHIVKLKTKREVIGINAIMGYKEIEIYSPLEVVENG